MKCEHLYLNCEKKTCKKTIYLNNLADNLPDYWRLLTFLLVKKKKKNPEFSLRPRCSFGTKTECETEQVVFNFLISQWQGVTVISYSIQSQKALISYVLYSMWKPKWHEQNIYTIIPNKAIKVCVLFIFKAHHCPYRAFHFGHWVLHSSFPPKEFQWASDKWLLVRFIDQIMTNSIAATHIIYLF